MYKIVTIITFLFLSTFSLNAEIVKSLNIIGNERVSDETIKTITKRVNGGYNGLKHRKEETKKIYKWLR